MQLMSSVNNLFNIFIDISKYSRQKQTSNSIKDLLKSEDLEEGRSNSSKNKGWCYL